MPAKTFRAFSLTFNRLAGDEVVLPAVDLDQSRLDQVNYFLVTEEVCPNTGKLHGQGYIQMKQPKSIKAMVDFLKVGPHIEGAKGDATVNVSYCKKGANYTGNWQKDGANHPSYGDGLKILVEEGTVSYAGKRNDCDAVVEAIKSGKKAREIADEMGDAYLKWGKNITAMCNMLIQPRNHNKPKEVHVFYGTTGTGKTRKAVTDFPDAYLMGGEMGKWFDGYEGESTVIFDEYRAQFTFGHLLRLLDRYAMRVEFKGGSCEFVADMIIITCPEHPETWYKSLDERDGKMAQLRRRITKIWEFTPGETVDVTDREWKESYVPLQFA